MTANCELFGKWDTAILFISGLAHMGSHLDCIMRTQTQKVY